MWMLSIPLLVKALVLAGVVAGLLTAAVAYRHKVWVEGRDAALEAVARKNEHARGVAQGVRITIDQCFDAGGDWDVATGTCDHD